MLASKSYRMTMSSCSSKSAVESSQRLQMDPCSSLSYGENMLHLRRLRCFTCAVHQVERIAVEFGSVLVAHAAGLMVLIMALSKEV